MKAINIIVVSTSLILASAYGLAGSNEKPEEHSQHHPAASVENPSEKLPSAQSSDMSMMADMQTHMQKMQETMNKIHAASSDAERKKLMDEHMKQMHEHMDMMKGMGSNGAGMGGMSAMKDKGDKQGMGMMEDGMKCSMMDRMDMMQMMMEQMMQHMATQQSKEMSN
jgi:hypothetical protein